MPRRDEALAAMRDALSIQDPSWDISPGSPVWKVLEAVAQQVENLTFNAVLNDFHFDVDKKSGLELDLFMSLFGFARTRARRATGEVTFSRGTPALQDYIIPLGTQVFVPATAFSPALYFQTTVSAVLPQGATEVSIPVQAVVGGSTGNVGSGAISGIATSVGGVTAVANVQPISGGRDSEADQDLRDRWRATNLRNISGTEDQFLGLAYNESAFVTRANLVGPIERYTEQVQLQAPYDLTTASPWATLLNTAMNTSVTAVVASAGTGDRFPVVSVSGGDDPYYIGIFVADAPTEIMQVTTRAAGSDTFTVASRSGYGVSHSTGATVQIRQVFPSSVSDSKFTYPSGGEVVGLDIGLTTQQVGRRGNDYLLVTDRGAVPHHPSAIFPLLYVTPVGASTFGLDAIVEMESEYTPTSSRNDPANHVAEKVDMFVDGVDSLSVVEQVPMRNDFVFGTNVTASEFLRDDGVNTPNAGNYYTQLSKAPVSAFPASVTVAATGATPAVTYYKDEDYWLVANSDDPSGFEGSPRASNGIEWRKAGTIATGTFSATRQGGTGKLNNYLAYVFTYEVDGVETLPHAVIHADDKNDTTNWGKNALVLPLYGGGGSTIWRKVYRTLGDPSTFNDTGPFYLLKVVRDNVTTAYLDNKPDSGLDTNVQPPKASPPVDAPLSIEYSYNHLIERLDAQVDLVRLVGMDTLVHSADDISLKFNLAIVVVPGMNITDLKSDLNTNLFAWIQRKSFQNNVQIADLIDVVSNASGVDNVRLARQSEARNEVQKITVTPPASTSPTRDLFVVTIGGVTSGPIVYNDSAVTLRETLESMSNIHEGNTYASTLNGNITSSSDTLLVDENAGLHVGGVIGGAPLFPLYIQIDDEVIYAPKVTDLGGTLRFGTTGTDPLKRAQLGTVAASHTSTANVHVLGDVGVARSVDGGGNTIYTISFLPNLYTGIDDWGNRGLDLITAAKATEQSKVSLLVQEKVSGSGWGIQKIAPNGQTIIDSFTTLNDIYLDSDELPSLFGVDVIEKARNTF